MPPSRTLLSRHRRDVPVAVLCRAVTARVAEPFVLIRRMVQYQVRNDSYVTVMRLVDEPIEVSQGAELRIDVAVVADVVAEIDPRRRVETCQPDGVDTEIDQLVQSLCDAVEVPGAITVAVWKPGT